MEPIPTTAESSEPAEPIVLGGRYRLGARIGAGSRGEVFAAHDPVGDRAVAIKLLHPASPEDRRRALREVAALRLLSVPGVVPLLDEGRHGPGHFIVMDRIDGQPFPGAGADDPAVLVERIRALLAILDRVHAAGIIHRDLKPANVLVEAGGRVVVLDFGLARGAALGATMTASGMMLGTPRYQAPEQMRGLAVDARADLYAVGVMAFEALAGRPPHVGGSLPELMRARLTEPAPALAELAPQVPSRVAGVVDLMLSRAPDARPGTAAEALALLSDDSPVGWPWLGPRDAIDAIVERLGAGLATTIGGPGRSGRTRALCEAADALAAAGRSVLRLRPGERPYASLVDLIDPSGLPGEAPLPERVAAAIGDALDSGLIVCADDTVDRWTARAISDLRGPVARVLAPDEPGDVTLGLVSADGLRPHFAGPERLFHLPEDAAAALVERATWAGGDSGGALRADLIDELGRWVRDGIARREGARFAVDRAALQRALARPRGAAGGLDVVSGPLADVVAAAHLVWPHSTPEMLAIALARPVWEVELAVLELAEEGALFACADGRYEPRAPASALPAWSAHRLEQAHARIAAALPDGADGRLSHLLVGSDPDAIVDEALRVAEAARLAGRTVEGIGLLQEALRAVRRESSRAEGAGRWIFALVRALARLALEVGDRPELAAARAELARISPGGPEDGERRAIDALLRARVALTGDDPAAVRQRMEVMPPLADEAFEVARLSVWATAAIYDSPAASAAALDAMAPWFDARPHLGGRFASWRGNLLYRQGRFGEAAALHLDAAMGRDDVRGRLSCLGNAAFALLEDFAFARAARIAETLAREARRRRMPIHEGVAARILRSVAYRTDATARPDPALVDAAEHLGHVTLPPLIALTEAAIAWRAGLTAVAADLAGRATQLAEAGGQRLVASMARALGHMIAPPSDPGVIEAAARAAEQVPLPRVAAQLLGMAYRTHPDPPAAWLEAARARAAATPRPLWGHRLEILSLAEATGEIP